MEKPIITGDDGFKAIAGNDEALKALTGAEPPESPTVLEPIPHVGGIAYTRRFFTDLGSNLDAIRLQEPGVHRQLLVAGGVLVVGGVVVGAAAGVGAIAALKALRRRNTRLAGVTKRLVRAKNVTRSSAASCAGAIRQRMPLG